MCSAVPLRQAWFLKDFQCLGDACEDTCCKGWGMQLTQETVDLYRKEAPEYLEAVTSGEAEHIMKRDPETDFCVKYDRGWCGIHKERGTQFLGDACHFFPRATRRVDGIATMSAALSCPEIVRKALWGTWQGEHFDTITQERLPFSLKDYQQEGLDGDAMLAVHQAFLDVAMDEAVSVEQALLYIRSVAASLPMLSADSWPLAVPFYLKQAQQRIPTPEAQPADGFNLLNFLCALIHASKLTTRPRLEQTMRDMEMALACRFDAGQLTLQTTPESAAAYESMRAQWHKTYETAFQPLLKRWFYAQLSIAFYPFSGLGKDAVERITIIAIRFATVRLALMSLCQVHGVMPEQEDIVRVVQSLSRFQDHLADPDMSLALYEQVGWTKEARLSGLVS